jgi:hypothetical protein
VSAADSQLDSAALRRLAALALDAADELEVSGTDPHSRASYHLFGTPSPLRWRADIKTRHAGVGAPRLSSSMGVPSIVTMTDVQSPDPDDGLSDEAKGKIRAAAKKYEESRKNPKPDHFGLFHPVYKVLNAIRWSRVVKKLPLRITNPLSYVLHVIVIYDTYRRMLTGEDPFADPFVVRPGQRVSMPAIFLVELFPPSEIDNLKRSLRRNKWSSTQIKQYVELGPALEEARSGHGLQWWRLGAVARRGSRRYYPDASIRRLPRNFDGVDLKAVQIGQGLTAVMARIDLTDRGAAKLNETWHRLFLPRIDWGKWGGAWPQAQGEKWTAFQKTQEARAALHKQARRWLRRQCPGVFATNGYPQPLIDILLFDGLDATFEKRTDEGTSDALRALGLSSSSLIERSDQLPTMVMTKADTRSDSRMDQRGTWSLWGGRDTVYEAFSEVFQAYGLQARDSSVAYWVEKAAESYFIRLAISELLSLSQIRYASMRDTARRSHAQYPMKHLRQLRSNLLTQSLDLSTIDRDVRDHNKPGWRIDRAKFTLEDTAWSAANLAMHGYKAQKPINLNKDLIKRQTRMLEALAVADRDYREILASAASLTSSMRSLRAGTIALCVALASLVVAGMALLLTDAPDHSQLDVILEWVTARADTISQWFSQSHGAQAK